MLGPGGNATVLLAPMEGETSTRKMVTEYYRARLGMINERTFQGKDSLLLVLLALSTAGGEKELKEITSRVSIMGHVRGVTPRESPPAGNVTPPCPRCESKSPPVLLFPRSRPGISSQTHFILTPASPPSSLSSHVYATRSRCSGKHPLPLFASLWTGSSC